jgi:ribosome-binding protein aMBF1 (putative translation factor)
MQDEETPGGEHGYMAQKERPCELCGRRHGRRAAIWIEGRGHLIVCTSCADGQERQERSQ